MIKNLLPQSMKKIIKRILGIVPPPPYQPIIYDSYAGKPILNAQNGSDAIRELLKISKNVLVARLGSVEQACIWEYIQMQEGKRKTWSKNTISTMANNAGVFLPTHTLLEQFATQMIMHLKQVDVLGVWWNEGEPYICENICPQATFAKLEAIEPYYSLNPWSMMLENKKVLVIHPFARSIEKQFQKRESLFLDKNILPNFELQTIKAVQSRGVVPSGFPTWFDALTSMQNEILKKDFDIAIIGCGAYGLPLSAFIKQIGKAAIHMGGATQILFGIRGKRWDRSPFFANLYNEHWIRPSEDEQIGGHGLGWTAKDYW